MFRNLTLKQISNILALILFVAAGVLVTATMFVNRQSANIESEWRQLQSVRSEKMLLLGSLRSVLGYGGMIHDLKNFILRKHPELLERTHEKLGGAEVLLQRYELLNLNDSEKISIEDIRKTLNRYEKALDLALNGIEENFVAMDGKESKLTSSEIAQLAKVDDAAAFRGLKTLSAEALSGSNKLSARDSKALLLSELNASIGYGGMIHSFKNYVIRHDEHYRISTLKHLSKLSELLAKYGGHETTRGEKAAISDVVSVVNAYAKSLRQATKMVAEGKTSEAIDQTVKVDDLMAFRGLNVLGRAISKNIEEKTRSLTESLSNVSKLANGIAIGVVIVAGLMIFLSYGLIRRRVVAPIQALSQSMSSIAKGDYNVVVDSANMDTEIGEMARAVEILKDNSAKRHEAEESLAGANEELNLQLVELTDIRERAEERAVEAVGLAEDLHFAKEDADKAFAQAKAGENRIRSLMNTVTDAIITADKEGWIEMFNPAAQTLFGYDVAEIKGQNVSFLMPEPNKSKHDGYLKNYLDGNPARITGRMIEEVAVDKSGREFPIELTVNPIHIDEDVAFIAVIRDITERKKAEEEIRKLAMTDSLTGLANRNAFMREFQRSIALSQRHENHLALLMLDLDKFKPVNDTYGHPVGDAVLLEVADQMREVCRETDVIARIGGDEFAIIMPDLDDKEKIVGPALKLIKALSTPMEAVGHKVQIGTSIGIAVYPDDGESIETLVTNADDALYAAKEAGRNTYRMHEAETPKVKTAK